MIVQGLRKTEFNSPLMPADQHFSYLKASLGFASSLTTTRTTVNHLLIRPYSQHIFTSLLLVCCREPERVSGRPRLHHRDTQAYTLAVRPCAR